MREPSILVRTYKGSSQAWAAKQMQLDDAPPGYVLAAQSWAPGGRSPLGRILLLAAAACFVVGFALPLLWVVAVVAVVIAVVAGGGRGELTVTWTKTQ